MVYASPVVLDSGVDYLTATAMNKVSRRELWAIGERLLKSESRSGNETKPWSFSGYTGNRCGSAQLGERQDSVCLRISSGLANENWRKVYRVADRFPRVDLQTTYRVDVPVGQLLKKEYKSMLRVARARKNASQVTLLRSSNGSSTIYSGHRSSRAFGRLYDKGAESHHPELFNCVRAEGEFKGVICLQMLRSIARAYHPKKYINGYVCSFFKARGLSLLPAFEPEKLISLPRKASDVERRLLWLQTQVGPTVKFLLDNGCRESMLAALGLTIMSADKIRSRKHA